MRLEGLVEQVRNSICLSRVASEHVASAEEKQLPPPAMTLLASPLKLLLTTPLTCNQMSFKECGTCTGTRSCFPETWPT